MADGGSQEYFHHAKGKSLERKWCSFAKKLTCKKDERMRAVFPAKGQLKRLALHTGFFSVHFTNAAERQETMTEFSKVFFVPIMYFIVF